MSCPAKTYTLNSVSIDSFTGYATFVKIQSVSIFMSGCKGHRAEYTFWKQMFPTDKHKKSGICNELYKKLQLIQNFKGKPMIL